MNPLPLVLASLRRNRVTAGLFVVLIAVAVALGIAISAQERALRQGSARAADRFDLIVAAPGSANDVLFSVIYLDPTAVELLDPETSLKVLGEPRAEFAAPIGFGDNHDGSPVIGTTAAFIDHLSGGLAEGRVFAAVNEAVLGALATEQIGDHLDIGHGHGHGHDADADSHGEEGEEEGHDAVTVVGRMKPTGTPWDRAVIVPIEYNWVAHGLGTGHADGETRIGPPFDPAKLPGIPAIVVKPQSVAAAYGLRNLYRTAQSTAFFPAEVLTGIYALMGNVAQVMSVLTIAAQTLVVAAILAGIFALLDLQRQRFAVLRALGAPARFIFATVWLYVTALIGAGALIGLPLGWAAAAIVSNLVAAQTGVAMRATVGSTEFTLVAILLGVGMLLALVPAALVYRRPVVEALRS
ncbi:MAG: ABC transporter permease [Mesorhizobium sp.]